MSIDYKHPGHILDPSQIHDSTPADLLHIKHLLPCLHCILHVAILFASLDMSVNLEQLLVRWNS